MVAQAAAGESRAAPKRGGHERRCHGLAPVAVPRIDVTAGRSGSILPLCRFGPSWPQSAGRLGRLPRDAGALVTVRDSPHSRRGSSVRGESSTRPMASSRRSGGGRTGTAGRRRSPTGIRPGISDRSTVASRAFQRGRVADRRHRSRGVRTFNAAVEAAGMTPQPTRRRAPPRVAVQPPRTPDSASRLLAVAMEPAGADVRRPGPEQIAAERRPVYGAR